MHLMILISRRFDSVMRIHCRMLDKRAEFLTYDNGASQCLSKERNSLFGIRGLIGTYLRGFYLIGGDGLTQEHRNRYNFVFHFVLKFYSKKYMYLYLAINDLTGSRSKFF